MMLLSGRGVGAVFVIRVDRQIGVVLHNVNFV